MQNYSTIIGVIDFRLTGKSYATTQMRHGVGSSTVTHIMTRFKSLGFSLDDLKKKDPGEVEKLFYPPENMSRSEKTAPDFEKIHKRMLKMDHPNLAYIWLEEYRKDNPDGYQLSQFYKLYKDYCKANFNEVKTSMPVERIPGERMYIDWMGTKPKLLVNMETGELVEVHIFVTTLGFSSCIYAEAFMNETLPNFITGVVNALGYYGAVPKYLVPDNLKTAVQKHTIDKLVLNPVFEDLEKFYGVVVLPPPARKPKGKATVEQAVKFLETRLIEPLKRQTYTSLVALNEEVKKIVAEINLGEFKDKKDIRKSRRSAFEAFDKPEMKPLATGNFTICDYKYYDHIPNNYHLQYDAHYYSVLYTHGDKPAILKATMSEVVICDVYNRLLSKHARLYGSNPLYSTHPEDMPPHHQFYTELNGHDGSYYRKMASRYGSAMEKLIDRILRSSEFEEQSYRSCSGVLHKGDKYPMSLAEEAAEKCIAANIYTYSGYTKAFDKLVKEKGSLFSSKDDLNDLTHDNLRGEGNFK